MARSQQQIVSLSDDEDETIADTMKWATNTQRKQMTTEGYCILDGPSNDFKSICLVEGYVRSCFVSHSHPILSTDLIREIVYYYDISLYNDAVYLELVLKNNNHRDMRFLIPKTNACASTFLRRQIEAQLTRISLPNVTACALHSILRYFNYHWINPAKEIEKPLKSNNMREIVSRWDADFINAFTDEELFELILAANYLDIKPLLDLSCAKVASEIKGKTPEEIRKRFGIANDFTPEEEEAVRAENRWAEDT